tara:strand:+ start:44803 stop:45495 length:693 start_codon:yes stop_codon:yes gene_type:complete
MKILLTGGSGLLGGELQKLNADIVAPDSERMDITDKYTCKRWIESEKPDVVLHAAAFTSPPICEKEARTARLINIIGTINLIDLCEENDIKFVYISTDYVFDGSRGLYETKDAINPINKYALTKAAGELSARTYDNTLVIRTSFCQNQFPYEKAFVDQYTSRDYVDVIAPKILNCALSDKLGIVHIGTKRKTVFDLARQRKADVGTLSISDVAFNAPKDTSFSDKDMYRE